MYRSTWPDLIAGATTSREPRFNLKLIVNPSCCRAWPYSSASTLPSENLKPATVIVPLGAFELEPVDGELPQAVAVKMMPITAASSDERGFQFIRLSPCPGGSVIEPPGIHHSS